MSSVKLDVKETVASVTGKPDLAHEVGNALTRGAGAGGYLAVSLAKPSSSFKYD
jgi:hypothetical protein